MQSMHQSLTSSFPFCFYCNAKHSFYLKVPGFSLPGKWYILIAVLYVLSFIFNNNNQLTKNYSFTFLFSSILLFVQEQLHIKCPWTLRTIVFPWPWLIQLFVLLQNNKSFLCSHRSVKCFSHYWLCHSSNGKRMSLKK